MRGGEDGWRASAKRLRIRRINEIWNRRSAEKRYSIEPLESRTLLSTIVWSNRGVLSGPNSDRVNDVFGVVNAGLVRPVIDAVLQSWSRVISNFNYPGGGNTYNMTIQFAASGTSVGANAGPSSYASDGKPLTGNMTIGRGGDGPDTDIDIDGDGVPDKVGDGIGWFLDTTPFDTSEFKSSTTNGFAGYTTDPASPANNLGDLYEVTLHEMGHAMGLLPTAQIQAHSTLVSGSTDTIDSAQASPPVVPAIGNYWRFDGPDVKTLETSYDSGGQAGGPTSASGSQHHAPAGASATVGGVTYLGSDDLMTPYYSNSQRRLISDTDAWMLADAYGYSITVPSTFGTFYDTLDADGTLRINPPGNGDDSIALSRNGSNYVVGLVVGQPVAGADISPTITSNFPVSSVSKIVINAGGGNDDIRIGYVGNAAITINGGAGNDTVSFSILDKNLDQLAGGNVVVNGGDDNDTINIYDNNNTRADTYRVNSNGISRDGWAGFTYGTGVEQVSLTTGSAANTVLITSTNAGQSLTLNSSGGADAVTVGGTGTAQSILGSILVQNSPNFTALTIDDTNDFGSRAVTIDNSGTNGFIAGITGPIGGTISWANSDISSIRVVISQFGSGSVTVRAVSRPLTIHCIQPAGTGANYAMLLGNTTNGMQSITANVTLEAAVGLNQILTLYDAADTTGRNTALVRSSLNGVYSVSGLAPGLITFSDFGSLVVQQGSGNDGFTAGGTSQGGFDNDLPMTVNGNGGNDAYTLTSFNNYGEGLGGTFTFPVMFDGGAGFNSLSIDDTARGNTSYQFYADRFFSREPTGFAVGGDFNYDNMGAIGVTCSNGNNPFAIFGTSPDIAVGNQITILLGGGNDTATLYPHDAQGNLTINGTIGIGGGAGTNAMIFDDTAGTSGIDYSFSNPFGAGTQDVFGIGLAGMGYGNDFGSATFNAGSGNDTFTLNQYRASTPLTINGNDGSDSFEVTPTSKNMGTNLYTGNNIFAFNGGNGSDSIGLHNDNNSILGDYYVVNGTSLNVSNLIGTPSFALFLQHPSVEHTTITAGPLGDVFLMQSTVAGTTYDVNGGPSTGSDSFGIGYPLSPALTSPIHGAINLDGGGGGTDTITVYNFSETAGRTVHIANHSIGSMPGDTLFSAGGSLHYTGITGTISVQLGSGADTVYAQPDAQAPISITGGNPTTAPGDSINLALAGATNYVLHGTSASGNVTSDNLKTLSYSGFESGPNVDAIAPTIVSADININGAANAPPPHSPSLDVQFSEFVALLLGAGSIQLTNQTIGQLVPANNLAFSFDTPSNTARFTFPGYPNRVLPDGNYQFAALPGSIDDGFGNLLSAGTPQGFFVLSADANHDRHVDTADFIAVAQSFNQSSGGFSQGDFNYDGKVNALDFNILASKFGSYLAPPPAGAQPLIESSPLAMRAVGDLFASRPISYEMDSKRPALEFE